MKFFEVEIGTVEDPEAVITVRVTADTGQTMGLTCVRACGTDMAGDLMAWTGSDETVRRRHTAWPLPPDRYRIEIRSPTAGAGETIVTAMAEDGSTASGSCQARHAYRIAVKLLQELRRFLRGPRKSFSPAGSDPLTQVGTAALNTAMPPASVAVEGGLDCFAGDELRSSGRRDRDRLAGLRIAPLPLRALGDPERPKAGNTNLITLLQRVRHNIDQSLQGFTRIGLAQSRLFGDHADQFCLVHGFPHSLRPPTSADRNLLASPQASVQAKRTARVSMPVHGR